MSSREPVLDGSLLAERLDVVALFLNLPLQRFGFLLHPDQLTALLHHGRPALRALQHGEHVESHQRERRQIRELAKERSHRRNKT
jgi:hypothetical protein